MVTRPAESPPVVLDVELFDGWSLQNPFWVASGHFSATEHGLRGWADFQPGAITLKTTAGELRAAAHEPIGQFRRHVDPCRGCLPSGTDRGKASPNLYCDGEPKDEYLSLDQTQALLSLARTNLPQTKVGISVMMGEDYREAARYLHGADFAELNLKYAARLRGRDDSWFKTQKKALGGILDQAALFCQVFRDIPVFIKLTRELPWLVPSKEFARFLRTIRRQRCRVGLVIANTRKVKVPANLVCDFEKEKEEQSGGILAGEHLYIETYNIIRSLKQQYRDELGEIPLIASGGIVSLASFIEVAYAGAKAAQVLTAFESYGLEYYAHMREGLEQLIRASRRQSYTELLNLLEEGAPEEIRAVRFNAMGIPARSPVRLTEQLRTKLPGLLLYLTTETQGGLRAAHSDEDLDQALSFGGERLRSARDSGLALLNSGVLGKATVPSSEVAIASPRSSLAARMLVGSLIEMRPYYRDKVAESNTALLQALTTGTEWDLAILTQPCLKELCENQSNAPARAVVLGHLLTTQYLLFGTREVSPNLPREVEVYYFPGREGDFVLNELSQRLPTALQRRPVGYEGLIFWLNRAGPYWFFLAKNPLCAAYVAIKGVPPLRPLPENQVPVRSYLLASERFLGRAGACVVHQAYADLRLAKLKAADRLQERPLSSAFEKEVKKILENYLHVQLT